MRGTEGGGAAVLPDDGGGNRLAAGAIPDHRGFTLVGDAESGNLAGLGARLAQGAAHAGQGVGPDATCVVFNPAVSGIGLRQFLLVRAELAPCTVEDNGSRRGRPLIDGQQSRHSVLLG